MNEKPFPNYPVPCVRIVAMDADKRIIVLQRAADSFMGGGWCLPGGKMDYNETPEQAAARELMEETGLIAKEIRSIGYQNSPPVSPGSMHAVNLYFFCETSGNLTVNPESQAHRWLTLEEAKDFPLEFGNGWAIQELLANGFA